MPISCGDVAFLLGMEFFKLFFTLPYLLFFLNQQTKVVTVEVPAYGGKVDGSCADDTQWIKISWGMEGTSMVMLSFEKSSDNTSWALSDFTASLYMDSKTFANASEGGLMHVLSFNSYLFGFEAVFGLKVAICSRSFVLFN